MRTFSFLRWLDDVNGGFENPKFLELQKSLESFAKVASDQQMKKLYDLGISFKTINRETTSSEVLKAQKKLEKVDAVQDKHDEEFNRIIFDIYRLSLFFSDDDHSDLLSIVTQERYRLASDKEQAEIQRQITEILGSL